MEEQEIKRKIILDNKNFIVNEYSRIFNLTLNLKTIDISNKLDRNFVIFHFMGIAQIYINIDSFYVYYLDENGATFSKLVTSTLQRKLNILKILE